LFETRIWHALRGFDPTRPVFLESESKKIGNLHTPEVLLTRMRNSACISLSAAIPVRVALLKQEYAHFLADAESLNRQLDCLVALQGRERIEAWKNLARAGRWDELVAELLVHHYDPAYGRSLGKNYAQALSGPGLSLSSPDPETIRALADKFLSELA
jgi:tRNA 2-selenouridine synthase